MTSDKLLDCLVLACHSSRSCYFRRGGAPGPFLLTLGLPEPRGSVRFGLGGCFLRAARFNFLRSSLSLTFFVFMFLLTAAS